MERRRKNRLLFLGGAERLVDIGGEKALKRFSSAGALSIKAIFKSDVIISIRWWDPVVTLMKYFKPDLIAIFVADGHFSLLSLNKNTSKRLGKNIFESNYCDVYILPDLISLQAVTKYPGTKYLYRPDYWDNSGVYFSSENEERQDIVFVYGNDPFFDDEGRKKLLLLVNRIKEKFGEQYRICHILPKGKNRNIIIKGLACPENIFIGIDSEKLVLSSKSIYLCTPSTMVWKLLSSAGKVALIDVYGDASCFHPAIIRIREPGDCEKALAEDVKYWEELRKIQSEVLGSESILSVIERAINDYGIGNDVGAGRWRCMTRHTLRDYLSSIWSIMSAK